MSTIKLAGDGTVSYIISFDKFGLLLRFKKKGPGSPKSVICVRARCFMSKKPDISGRVQEGRYTQLRPLQRSDSHIYMLRQRSEELIDGLDATLYYYASKILLRSTYNYLAF
jgi:hypothetical protein